MNAKSLTPVAKDASVEMRLRITAKLGARVPKKASNQYLIGHLRALFGPLDTVTSPKLL